MDHLVVPGHAVICGDWVAEHDATVVSIDLSAHVVAARLRCANGTVVHAFWGADASMAVGRLEPDIDYTAGRCFICGTTDRATCQPACQAHDPWPERPWPHQDIDGITT